MAQLTCQRLCVGYEGKSVLQELNFEIFAGCYLHRRRKRFRQEYTYENDSRLAATYQRQNFDRRWAEEKMKSAICRSRPLSRRTSRQP